MSNVILSMLAAAGAVVPGRLRALHRRLAVEQPLPARNAMTATTNSSGCRARRYSPIPTCAPRLSWPRPNAPTPGTAPRLRRSTGLAAAPRDATGRARGHARTHRGDRKQLRSLTPCPRSATEPVLVRLRHLAVAATTRRVLRRCVAPSPRDHDHRLIAGHSGRSCPVGDCRWSATQTRLLGTPPGAGESHGGHRRAIVFSRPRRGPRAAPIRPTLRRHTPGVRELTVGDLSDIGRLVVT